MNWSIPIFKKIHNYSDEMKLLEQIIWYSKYYHILIQIKPGIASETIRNLAREIFSKKDEMSEIGNYILDLIYAQDSGFNRKTNNIIFSTLNAIFIKRLLKNDLFKYLDKLDEIIY